MKKYLMILIFSGIVYNYSIVSMDPQTEQEASRQKYISLIKIPVFQPEPFRFMRKCRMALSVMGKNMHWVLQDEELKSETSTRLLQINQRLFSSWHKKFNPKASKETLDRISSLQAQLNGQRCERPFGPSPERRHQLQQNFLDCLNQHDSHDFQDPQDPQEL